MRHITHHAPVYVGTNRTIENFTFICHNEIAAYFFYTIPTNSQSSLHVFKTKEDKTNNNNHTPPLKKKQKNPTKNKPQNPKQTKTLPP